MIVSLALLAASLAAADPAPAAAPNAPAALEPVGAESVATLKERFIGATDEAARGKFLEQLALTTPVSAQDVSALFDLFSRYSDPTLRQKVMASLKLLQPENPQLEPLFVSYLSQPEPETQLFGVNGAFRLRSRLALPLVRKIAKRKFKAANAAAINVLSERNAWWTQYEALSALAQWEGDKDYSLVRKKAKESPEIARLLGQYYWIKTFPDLKRWAVSSDLDDQERALEASGAPIAPADARATRDGMIALMNDPKTDPEVRHRLALKVGACSTDAEVPALIAEHDKAADDKSRLLWAAAVFAARSPNSIPLLVRYAKTGTDESLRGGARAELVDMVGEEKTKALLEPEKTVVK